MVVEAYLKLQQNEINTLKEYDEDKYDYKSEHGDSKDIRILNDFHKLQKEQRRKLVKYNIGQDIESGNVKSTLQSHNIGKDIEATLLHEYYYHHVGVIKCPYCE